MRVSTSRPKLSVPIQWAADGGFSASAKLRASGSCRRTNGPMNATAMAMPSISMPITKVRGRSAALAKTDGGPGAASSISACHRGARTRIEEGDEDVGEQIHEHDEHREGERDV